MTVGDALEVQRGLTTAFIERLPVWVTLIPHERQKTPAGGYKRVALPPRAMQRMTLIEPPDAPLATPAQDGVVQELIFTLLGEWDAEIGKDDEFDLDGHHWKVESVFHNNGWEVRARVVRLGG